MFSGEINKQAGLNNNNNNCVYYQIVINDGCNNVGITQCMYFKLLLSDRSLLTLVVTLIPVINGSNNISI